MHNLLNSRPSGDDSSIDKTLLGDVIALAHSAAKAKGFIGSNATDYMEQVARESITRANFSKQSTSEGRAQVINEKFADIQKNIGALNDGQAKELSNLTAFDAMVVNAVNSALRAHATPKAEDQIAEYLKTKLNAGDKDAAVKSLQEGLDKMVVSLTHTMHPTIYHTPEARRFEARLSTMLENPEYLDTRSGEPHLSEAGKKALTELFYETPPQDGKDHSVGFLTNLADGKVHITPQRAMTVVEETRTEEDNYRVIRDELANIVKSWNSAVSGMQDLTDEQRQALTIDEARQKRIFELRTWGQSADADGREKSTSAFLYESIKRNTNAEGVYAGPTLDLRQNARAHLDYMSALVQVKFRNSRNDRYFESKTGDHSFQQFCHDFMNKGGRQEKYRQLARTAHDGVIKSGSGKTRDVVAWDGSDKSIIQQLDSDDRFDFIAALITGGHKLLPDRVGTDVREYMEEILPIRRGILNQYQEEIRKAGFDPETITYEDMVKVNISQEGTQVTLRAKMDAAVESAGWIWPQGELQYRRLSKSPDPSAEEMQVKNFLQGAHKIAKGSGEQVDLGLEERATLMDIGKRMIVLNDAIDKHGEKVATRYQIANFSEAADFLINLKLFQETGLVEVEKDTGRVTKAKAGIMPLLETEDDLKNAKAIFSKLLDNDSARSFWEKRGKAEIMLGFSDGAASAGNFASQWAIHKASRELVELFAEKGIKVEFFQGRGRGTDRGGTIDPSLQFDLLPPEMTCHGRYDVTIQSDLPMDLAASPSYGQDYFTKILLGTLNAYVDGKGTRDRLESLKGKRDVQATRDPIEDSITWIANRASEVYNNIVRSNPEALVFFNNSPDNPNRSSRATARGGATKYDVFDNVRAIPKEYLSNAADLQMHNVGLATAMNEFSKQHGAKALSDLLKNNKFSNAMVSTIQAGVVNFDPVIATAMGKATKSEKFVNAVVDEVGKLPGMLDYYVNGGFSSKRPPASKVEETSAAIMANVIDHIGHGIVTVGLEKGKAPRPNINNDRTWGETLYNGLFAIAQENGHRTLQRNLQAQQNKSFVLAG